MNSGFANLRSSLPMNLKARHPGHKIWAGAQPDIDRIVEIWSECLAHLRRPVPVRRAARDGRRDVRAGGHALPDLRREARPSRASRYCETIMAMPEMNEWIAAAKAEPEDIEELDMEF